MFNSHHIKLLWNNNYVFTCSDSCSQVAKHWFYITSYARTFMFVLCWFWYPYVYKLFPSICGLSILYNSFLKYIFISQNVQYLYYYQHLLSSICCSKWWLFACRLMLRFLLRKILYFLHNNIVLGDIITYFSVELHQKKILWIPMKSVKNVSMYYMNTIIGVICMNTIIGVICMNTIICHSTKALSTAYIVFCWIS